MYTHTETFNTTDVDKVNVRSTRENWCEFTKHYAGFTNHKVMSASYGGTLTHTYTSVLHNNQ